MMHTSRAAERECLAYTILPRWDNYARYTRTIAAVSGSNKNSQVLASQPDELLLEMSFYAVEIAICSSSKSELIPEGQSTLRKAPSETGHVALSHDDAALPLLARRHIVPHKVRDSVESKTMERSTFFGRSAPLCQPSCSRPNGHSPADRLVVCVATPARPPTAKVAKR